MSLTVLMNAGPWLSVPPPGYGGIENVVATLVPELRRLGVRVVLASVETSTLPVDEKISVFPDGQFHALQRPYNQVCGVSQAHLSGVVRALHPATTSTWCTTMWRRSGWPPWPRWARTPRRRCTPCTGTWRSTRSSTATWTAATGSGSTASPPRSWPAPRRRCAAHSVGHVHLSTPLAVDADRAPLADKGDYVIILGRINPGKGQDLGARLAQQVGRPAGAGRAGRAVPPAGGPGRGRRRGAAEPRRAVLLRPRRAARRRRPGPLGRHRRRAGARRPARRCPRLAVPAALGGARRHRRGRVPGPGYAGGRPPPGAACPSSSSTGAPDCSPPTRRSWASWCWPPACSTRTSAAGRPPPRFTPAVMARAVRRAVRAGPPARRPAAPARLTGHRPPGPPAPRVGRVVCRRRARECRPLPCHVRRPT